MSGIYQNGLSSVFSNFSLKTPITRFRLGVLLAIIGLGGALIIWILNIVFWQPSVTVPRDTGIAPAATETLRPTALDEVAKLFAPWESPEVNSSGEITSDPRALTMLREDGGTRVASWGVKFLNKNWSLSEPPEISRLSVHDGKALLMTNKGRIFAVAVMQPFILEQTPQQVYLVAEDRTIWTVSAQVAETLRYRLK